MTSHEYVIAEKHRRNAQWWLDAADTAQRYGRRKHAANCEKKAIQCERIVEHYEIERMGIDLLVAEALGVRA